MDTPQPIDINRLKNMLGGAKAIMNKVESGDYSTGNVDAGSLAIGDQLVEQAPNGGGGVATRPVTPQMQGGQAYYPNLEKSKMPAAIKEAMMSQPIPQIGGIPQTFTLDEVMDFEKDEKPIPAPSAPRTNPKPRQQVVETVQQKVNINEAQIRKIIKEEMRSIVKDEMIEFFTKYFAKSLAEDTQKKLIQHLLKEGKLAVKKKN